jgi:EAL domain-containing protein (putative c-di-GMP-specific phosphodiesterase class I)/CheY-like chemotaxis protein
MIQTAQEGQIRSGWFGQRKLTPRACIADRKKHLRIFLAEALEDCGFITGECAQANELDEALDTQQPDLLVLGVSVDGIEIDKILATLVRREFAGKVLVIGQPESIMVKAVRQIGDEYGIDMLPPLLTPFDARSLRACVEALLPTEPAPSPPVDVAEALKAGWLELWYQQKINLRSFVPSGAEALVRMRHPAWGVVPPAYFIPDERDPHFHALSEFVIGRAIEDWRHLLEQKGPTDLSINLPVSFLRDREAVREMCRRMPDHPAFGGLLIELDSREVIDNLDLVIDVARLIRLRNIAISVDNVGVEWPSLMGLQNFPFFELKVDQQFVTGCADDRLKQTVCRQIVEFGREHGARVLALGIESRADCLAAHAIGFDLVQGFLFGKPMPVRKFARSRPLPESSAGQAS